MDSKREEGTYRMSYRTKRTFKSKWRGTCCTGHACAVCMRACTAKFASNERQENRNYRNAQYAYVEGA